MAHLSGREAGEAELNSPDFPPAFFGYHRKAVDQYLQELLQSKLASAEQISRYPDSTASGAQVDRYRELGSEIGDLLRSVQDTAARIRRQAEEDAARWRGEATTEVEKRIVEAQAAAEELRASAWEVATEMIAQLQEVEVETYHSIEKHSQEIIAEAENESHRIREDARRRAESIRSDANVESLEVEERTRTLCDQMIDSAQQRVSAIQERVLALERHRDQLLEEIGGIRSGAAPIGVKLVDQTGALIYRPAPEVEEIAHVTPQHEMSGLVRVIPPDESEETSTADLPQPQEAVSDPEGDTSAEALAPGVLSDGPVAGSGPDAGRGEGQGDLRRRPGQPPGRSRRFGGPVCLPEEGGPLCFPILIDAVGRPERLRRHLASTGRDAAGKSPGERGRGGDTARRNVAAGSQPVSPSVQEAIGRGAESGAGGYTRRGPALERRGSGWPPATTSGDVDGTELAGR